MIQNRKISCLIFISCVALIAVSLYMQFIMELRPCYLCVTQRFFITVIGFFSFLAFIHNTGYKIYGALTTGSALIGGYFASKQLWLQSLPADEIPSCGPPVEYLFNAFNLSEALKMLVQGDGNCSTVQWIFLGLSIPGWTLVSFIAFVILGVSQIVRKK